MMCWWCWWGWWCWRGGGVYPCHYDVLVGSVMLEGRGEGCISLPCDVLVVLLPSPIVGLMQFVYLLRMRSTDQSD